MKKQIQLTSAALHLLAMALMLFDHLWGTVVPGNDWMTCVGRLSFPIFAFLLVEGYFHTTNLKKYASRLLLFALLSEIPFDLVMGSRLFYPIHQNVLWSFLISLGLIHLNEKARTGGVVWKRILTAMATVLLGALVGLVTMVDFYHAGVLTVLVFYFFRRGAWWSLPCQLVGLWYINIELLGGYGWDLSLLGHNFFLARQGFALLALIPIWLYRGERGYHAKWFRWFCYGFYPLHLLVLGLLKIL